MKKMKRSARGKSVAKTVHQKAEPDEIFGFLAGKGEIVGDLVSPIFSPSDFSGGDLKTRKSKRKRRSK
jgi:hypothetical protein